MANTNTKIEWRDIEGIYGQVIQSLLKVLKVRLNELIDLM